LTFTTEIRVRYADTDQMGVVYNANYLRFFEIGRTELMRNFGLPYIDVEKQGFLLPLIDAYTKYINPARYDDIVCINATLELESAAKIKFNYAITVLEKVICEGYTRHVFVNAETMKPTRPPKFFTDIINK